MNRARCGAFFVMACLLAAAAPASAQARRDLAPPTPVHHVDHGLLAAGVTTLSLAWSATTVLGMSGFSGPASPSIGAGESYAIALIPIIGPVVWGAMTLDNSVVRAPHLAVIAFIDAGIQAVGLALLIAGLVGVDDVIPEIAEGVVLLPTASLDGAGLMMAVEL